MQKIRVLAVPGTWDSKKGMLAGVTRHLNTQKYSVTWIDYPATFALPTSYAESKKRAIEKLSEEWARDTKAPIVLLGYSQGAEAVGDFALTVAGHPRLKAVALVADPKRPHGLQIGTRHLHGHGICGERHIPHSRVFQAAIPGDVVCDAARGSLWRLTADLTTTASLDVPRWVVAMLRTVLRADMQLMEDMGTVARLWGALSTVPELAGYLAGLHTSYGCRECPGMGRDYLAELAYRLNRL